MSAPPEFEDLVAQSERMEKDSPLLTRLHLFLPIALVVTAVAGLAAAGNLPRVAAAAVAALFYLGKFVILTGAAPDSTFGMTSHRLALLVFFMDMVVAYFFAYNLHHVYRIPRVGPWIRRLQNFCRFWLSEHPWMRKWAFTGVVLFVMFPLTGTGAPGGSLLGRIVGLKPATTLLGIALGSALGCSIMAVFAVRLEPVFHDIQHQWWFQVSGLLILAILLIVIIRLGRKLSMAAERHARVENAGGDT